MLQPPQLSAHFVARPIFVSPALPPKPLRTARPFGPVHRLPPPASISTSTPSAAQPYLAPPTAALLHERTAKPMRHHAVSSSPFNSFETNKEENSTAAGCLPSSPSPPRPYKMHPHLRLFALLSLLPSFALLHVPSHPTPSTTVVVSSSSPLASPRHCPGHQSSL
jgi:hypothetical protein